MKGCAGAILGLVIGAAFTFCFLLVSALVINSTGGCQKWVPEQWAVRVDTSQALLSDELVGKTAIYGNHKLIITGVQLNDCGSISLRGQALINQKWHLGNLAVELGLVKGSDGQMKVTLLRLWFGRLPVALAALPSVLRVPLEEGLNNMIIAAISGQQSYAICGFSAEENIAHIYLCEAAGK